MNRYRAVNDYASRPSASLGPLFDHAAEEEAEQRRDSGIARASRKAGSFWTGYALLRLEELCRTQRTVWAGDLRAACELTPASPFAWSAPWRMARTRGWIDPKPVDHKVCDWADAQAHLSPVYRSQLYGQRKAAA
ncbi:MAG TPA: hypothetical protein VNM48_02600 [Chloroflexota bacterium]|nr:hypothetical protein [Chloroflexota bacterium]